MKKYLNISLFYLILGLISGVFYREFTKINNFDGKTVLSAVHGHALTLGFVLFLMVLVFDKVMDISIVKTFKEWIVFYNVSLLFAIVSLISRGVLQITGKDFSQLSHIAGLSHMMLAAGLIWFVVILYKSVK